MLTCIFLQWEREEERVEGETDRQAGRQTGRHRQRVELTITDTKLWVYIYITLLNWIFASFYLTVLILIAQALSTYSSSLNSVSSCVPHVSKKRDTRRFWTVTTTLNSIFSPFGPWVFFTFVRRVMTRKGRVVTQGISIINTIMSVPVLGPQGAWQGVPRMALSVLSPHRQPWRPVFYFLDRELPRCVPCGSYLISPSLWRCRWWFYLSDLSGSAVSEKI